LCRKESRYGMRPAKAKIVWLLIITFGFLQGVRSATAFAQPAKKPFTIADEIGLTLFSPPNGGEPELHFSPDGKYFAVWAERGRLDLNHVEDSLTFYRCQDIETFLGQSNDLPLPAPLSVVTLSDKNGPIIRDWRWLSDSSGVAFLKRAAGGNEQLVLAGLRRKAIEPLTSAMENVKSFDIRDRHNYVYSLVDPAERERMRVERQSSVIIGTGRSLFQLLFPDDPKVLRWLLSPHSRLWAVVAGKRFEVERNGMPVHLEGDFVLSPSGTSLVTILPVLTIPSSWETLYPPPLTSYPDPNRQHYLIRVGSSAHQYVRIDLQTGSVEPLTDAPISRDAAWWASSGPTWSNDGRAVLLPGTFIKSKDQVPSRPCVAVVDLSSKICTCVEMLKGHAEAGVQLGERRIDHTQFANGDKRRVIVSFINRTTQSLENTEYRFTADGMWQVVGQSEAEPAAKNDHLEISVKQGLNDPPILMAKNGHASRVIWDPNPQIKDIELGQASVYTWKDEEGRERKGGLFKPSNFRVGQRYPMVIQTHGFAESEFRPSGVFPTAFAARALAAAGIVVLQIEEGCPLLTPSEGPCAVSVYASAVKQLVSDGLVDPQKIGIVGFSRTCFYVMDALTTDTVRFKAASISDGFLVSYPQYMLEVGTDNGVLGEADSMIGAKPFGEGLQEWLKRSPDFNLDKITAALLVVGIGPGSLLGMWEPYAGLRYLQKPVDLMMLNSDEHVLTNPALRFASQGGTVDWFRFWLKGEEDPNPAKDIQYSRWHELRKLQEASENNLTARQAASE
jgi:hypothetical protein